MAGLLEDFGAGYKLLASGSLDPFRGQFVAILNGQVVGSGTDSVDLRMKASKEQLVHPERLAVIHIFDQVVL